MKVSQKSLELIQRASVQHLDYLTCVQADRCACHKKDFRKWSKVCGNLMLLLLQVNLADKHSECRKRVCDHGSGGQSK
jgi:hypothetical protein